MKKTFNYIYRQLLICSLAVFVTACAPAAISVIPIAASTPIQTELVEGITETPDAVLPATNTPITTSSSSAPQDELLDLNCRITINSFFSFRKGFDVQSYRNMFVSQSLADAYALHPPTEPRIILVLMPSSQWWQKNFPTAPMPNIYKPEGPNEYTYYVEFTGSYESDETPVYIYPDFMTILMVSDGPYSCKIKNYGKG